MTNLRIGVVGTGVMGSNHARTLASLPGAALAGVMDMDQTRAKALAEALNCPVIADLDGFRGNCDAVVVSAATSAHAAIGQTLLGQGLPCLIEKPLAGSDADCALLQAAAEKAGVALAVGHIERFNPAFRAARAKLAGRRILSLDARRLNPGSNRITDTDVIADLMLHDMDAALVLLDGSPSRVSGRGLAKIPGGLTDQALILAEINGVPCSFQGSRLWPTRVRVTALLLEDGNLLEIDFLTRTLIETAPDGTQAKHAHDTKPQSAAGRRRSGCWD
jgi:predicted dehydrogenase